MASNLRVDTILPSTGTNVAIGTASGSVTFLGDTDITTSGSVSIGGTLTYEDVTNVDSVGVITARSGIDAASNLLLKTGGTERARIDSSGRVLIGDTDTDNAFSGGDSLVIGNTSSGTRSGITLVSATDQDGGIYFSDGGSTGSANVQGQIVYDHNGTGMKLYTAASERLRIGSAGQLGIGGANYGTSGQVLTSQGASSLPTWATASGGISDFDTWYLTADTTGNTNPIINNWSRWTNYGGTGSVTFAAPSSGIWTFPSTGYWKIEFVGRFSSNGNTSDRGCNISIYVATDGTNYSFVTQQSTNLHKASDNTNITRGHAEVSYIFDVTNTSTHKIKVDVGYQQINHILQGHGTYLQSHIKFFKLRDT